MTNDKWRMTRLRQAASAKATASQGLRRGRRMTNAERVRQVRIAESSLFAPMTQPGGELKDKQRIARRANTGLRIPVMSTKEILLEVAEKLPPDATLVDAIYELEFRQAVEDGLASLDRRERVPLEEARKRIPEWISKYSSPTKP